MQTENPMEAADTATAGADTSAELRRRPNISPAKLDTEAQTVRTELEAALRGFRDGSATEEETADAMERMVANQLYALKAELAQLQTAVDGSDATFHERVKAYFGHLTEAPTNWHQATVLS